MAKSIMQEQNGCHNCDSCQIVGYDPRKYINTISYWCEDYQAHISPENACDRWSEGDPWEKERGRWFNG